MTELQREARHFAPEGSDVNRAHGWLEACERLLQ
jgi:hypothetical protein